MSGFYQFKTPLKTLGKSLLKEQPRTAEQEDLQGNVIERVLVPQPLDKIRPTLYLVDFIYDEQVSAL